MVGAMGMLAVLAGGAFLPATAGAAAPGPVTITASPGEEFLSPSKNISCELDWHYAGLPPSAYCQSFSPMQSVTISPAGKISKCSGAQCVGNPATNARVLPYLTSITIGPFLCTSRIDGVACSAAGRAFLVSRSGVDSFNVLPRTTLAVYADPAGHPALSAANGYGRLVAVDRSGQRAELVVSCGSGSGGRLRANSAWTVDLSSIRSFEVETDPANVASGSVIEVSRSSWVGTVRVNGWDGYFYLGGKNPLVTDGPGNPACAG